MRRVSLIPLLMSLALVGCEDPVKPVDTDIGDTAITDDLDGDGSGADADCDNGDPARYPGNAELCDGIDNDCDEVVDNGATTTYYIDADGDGAGDIGTSVEACEAPDGYVASSDDCNDADDEMRPGLPEACDEKDNDCDGTVDEDAASTTWFRDADSDSYGDPDDSVDDCIQPDGYVANSIDCDDTSALEPVHVAEGGTSLPDTGDSGVDTAFAALPGGMDNPLGSIQEGIDLSNACVFVHTGEYVENIDFTGKNILVLGVDGAASTTIRGTGTGPVVTFASSESSAAVLRSFTITEGGGVITSTSESSDCGYRETCTTYTDSYRGGGIYVDGAGPSLIDLVVLENVLPDYAYSELSSTDTLYVYSMGGGIYVANGTPTVTSSLLLLNSADEGGGLWLDGDSNVSVTKTAFGQNDASSGGGVASYGSLSLTASGLAFNTASGAGGNFGGAAFSVGGGTSSFLNVTMYSNIGAGGSGYVGASGTATLSNSIAATNTAGPILDGEVGASVTVAYSDVYDGAGSNYGSLTDETGVGGNISADPAFSGAGTTWLGSDFQLDASSPAVNAGNPAAAYNDVDGSRNDMGAYGGPEAVW